MYDSSCSDSVQTQIKLSQGYSVGLVLSLVRCSFFRNSCIFIQCLCALCVCVQKPLSLLKMDIEEWEWKVLPSLLAGGHLSDTKQLLMELHQCDGCSQYNPDQIDKEPPRERYVTALGILKDLYDIGFRIFWRHQNQACRYVSKFGLSQRSACCEIHMVQTGQGTN